MSNESKEPPLRRRHLLWSFAALLVLIPTWAYLSVLAIAAWRPEWIQGDDAMHKFLIFSVAAPTLLIAALAGWRWSALQAGGTPTSAQPSSAASMPATDADAGKPDYALEVIGLGVTLDKYRQGRLWDAISKGDAHASIREQDPKKYPWGAREKEEHEGGRLSDALENGARELPMYWGMPGFGAGWGRISKIDRTAIFGDPETSGMIFQLFVGADGQMGEHPDNVMERVFSFFDEHPDVPYVVVSSDDGLYGRNFLRKEGTPPLITDGYYIPSMPDSSVLLVLARRDRVDRIRPFAFEDANEDKMLGEELNQKGFARRLMVAYMTLAERLGKMEGALERRPTVAEWLQETRAFSQRTDIYPKHYSMLDAFEKNKHPPKDFRPTPWFPIPWNKDQLAAFDRLPTLGFIHRPVFVKTVDEHGQPLSRRDARAAALAAGWQAALQTLPESDRKAAPARVVTGSGGNVEQTIALHAVLNGWAHDGGPELDANQPTQWIDTDIRLGNTGAATWFMQMAIGVMGSYKEGGASAAINLRDPREASIVFITPPSEEKRKSQLNAAGGDVWRSIVGPGVDPANYQQP